MNIHTIETQLFDNLLATKKIKELKEERNNCFIVMIDDETLNWKLLKIIMKLILLKNGSKI